MPQLNTEQAFLIAVAHHQAGRLQQAESLYRQILARESNHAGSLHNLGLIAYQIGRLDVAVDLIQQALTFKPFYVEAIDNLGLALKAKGSLEQAIAAHRRAIALKPEFAQAHRHLGVALTQAGLLDDAVAALGQAVTLRPSYVEAHNDLGNAFQENDQLDEAIAAYRQAIALNPDLPRVHSNLGNALVGNGQLDEAIAAFRQAIALRPDFAEARSNLGNTLRDKGQLDEAIEAYRQALLLEPDYPEALSNLGNALREKGQLDQAIAACRQAVALKHDYPEAHNNLGNALTDKGHQDEAIAVYRQALLFRPDYPEALSNLGKALWANGQLDESITACRQAVAVNKDYGKAHSNLGNALKDQGRLDEAIAEYRQAIALEPSNVVAHSNLVFVMHYHPSCDSHTIAEEHRHWDSVHAQPLRQFIKPHSNDRTPERRLRIGYVSPDFRNHPAGRCLLPLLAHHDKSQVEVFAYSQVTCPDPITGQLRSLTDGWRNTVGLSNQTVADLIRRDRIDILVDLAMHMANNRLLVFAHKPAPVQVTWLGYPGSTGLSAIDYRLSDPYLDPPGMDESVYSERTLRLPDTFWCHDPLDTRDIPVGPLPALESASVTFGCLNNFCKINDMVLALWARVMRQLSGSRLLLLAGEGSHRQRLLDRLFEKGIDPSRIEFAPRQPRRDYLTLYHRIDIGLDSFPYNGHTTSLDSFWMGVPVVTLVGQTPVSRAGWCQLSNLGLTDLAGHTPEQFVRIALELAGDLPRLQSLRATLRQRMEQSPLMDAPRFARNIEAAYRQMWRTWSQEQQ